jgi:hypothetical protein
LICCISKLLFARQHFLIRKARLNVQKAADNLLWKI